MQIQNIQNLSYCKSFSGKSPLKWTTLRSEISDLKTPTKEIVKDLYGTFGLDIYEGKQSLTILSNEKFNKSKNIISKLKTLFIRNTLFDYQESDTLKDVIFKYAANEKSGLVKDIETKFGKRGLEELEHLGLIGYINL